MRRGGGGGKKVLRFSVCVVPLHTVGDNFPPHPPPVFFFFFFANNGESESVNKNAERRVHGQISTRSSQKPPVFVDYAPLKGTTFEKKSAGNSHPCQGVCCLYLILR